MLLLQPPHVAYGPEQTVGEVLLPALPLDRDGLADEPRPAVAGAAVPELFLEDAIREMVIFRKLKRNGDAPRFSS